MLPIANPRLVRAVAASEAPVPPSATAKSVIPDIAPPVMETLSKSWVEIVPSPNEVRAVAPDSAAQLVPLPTMKLPSVTAIPAIVVRVASYA